ncbi:MAG: TonB-dependent receptor plug domain-containing protein [Nitrospinales bacterium]
MSSNRQKKAWVFFLLPVLCLVFPDRGVAQDSTDFMGMELQQLMQMDVVVTSVSKRPQKLHETASAIYVVTQEDIRRTGAVNLMEALRIVPGVLVSKINQNRFAVSIRGFNRGFGSDKLLVLIDGRSVYSPVSSGVNKGVRWVVQDVVLEDLERIEVIRGPGAALWGSNAVAGVINIITKSATETQGFLAAAGAGTEERAFGTLRYGGKLGKDFYYRLYGKYRDRDEGKLADGADSFDDKQMGQFGLQAGKIAAKVHTGVLRGADVAPSGRARRIVHGVPVAKTIDVDVVPCGAFRPCRGAVGVACGNAARIGHDLCGSAKDHPTQKHAPRRYPFACAHW